MSNSPIRTIETTLTDFLHTPDTQLRIPIYQRPFTWGKKGDKSCNDKLRGFVNVVIELTSAPEALKFFGFIVTYPEGKLGHRQRKFFNVIDGQQRLTSMSLILLCLVQKLDDLERDLSSKINTLSTQDNSVELNNLLKNLIQLSNEIYTTYIVFPSSILTKEPITESALRLRTGRRDLFSYLKLVNKCTPLSDDESAISNGYQIIDRLLAKEEKSSFDSNTAQDKFRFIEGIYSALRRLHIATLEVQDPALGVNSIFESINFKGEKLSDFDLIRNFVIEFFENHNEAESMFLNRWEKMEMLYRDVFGNDLYETELENSIFNHLKYLSPKTDKVARKDIFEIFAARYSGEKRDRRITSHDIQTVIDHSVVYLKLLKPEVSLGEVEGIVSIAILEAVKFQKQTISSLQTLFRMGVTVPIPFMMAVVLSPKGNRSPNEIVSSAAQKVTSFFVRHDLSGGTTKSLLQPFTNIKCDYQDTPSAEIGDISAWIVDNLTKRTKSGSLAKMYPDNQRIADYIKSANVYEDHYDVVKFVLFEINKLVMDTGYDAKLCQDYELDHIMPQTPNLIWEESLYKYHKHDKKDFPRCVNQLGNLTLVREKMNASLGNDSYPERCKVYPIAAVKLTTELPTKYPRWHFDPIKERTKYLTDLILKRFE